MLHAYDQRFDMIENLDNFCDLKDSVEMRRSVSKRLHSLQADRTMCSLRREDMHASCGSPSGALPARLTNVSSSKSLCCPTKKSFVLRLPGLVYLKKILQDKNSSTFVYIW